MSVELRRELGEKLLSHDWWWSWSEDRRVLNRGRVELSEIRDLVMFLGCPWVISDLKKWALGGNRDEWEVDESGKWWRVGRSRAGVRGARESELLEGSVYREISEWMGVER